MSSDSFGARAELEVSGRKFEIHRLDALQQRFDVARLPYSLKVLLENALRLEDGDLGQLRRRRGDRDLGCQGGPVGRDPLPARPRADAGLHRRPRRRRPRRDARRDGGAGRRPGAINPQVDVDLIIDHSVQVDAFGNQRAFDDQRRARLRAKRRALRLPALGADAPSTTSGSCPRPPGSATRSTSSTSAQCVCDPGLGRGPRRPIPDTLVGHRLAHDDDQRPRRPGLGRGRDRGRGRDARPADLDAAPPGHRLQARRRAPRGRHRDRSRPDRHGDAPGEGRRRQVRRVLRPGISGLGLADRATIGNMSPEFGSTCAIFPIDVETLRYLEFTGRPDRADRARRCLHPGAGPLPRARFRGADLQRHARARPRRRRAEHRRA